MTTNHGSHSPDELPGGLATPDRAPQAVLRTTVSSVRSLGAETILLRLDPGHRVPALPSQFFMLSRADGAGPLIPRPFSIYRLPEGQLEFLIKVEGPGTRALARCRPGEEVLATGPLGRSWPEHDPRQQTVLVAGGVGIVPFPLYMERALARGAEPSSLLLCYAARSSEHLVDLESFQSLGMAVHTATDDGSFGFHGRVTELLRHLREKGEIMDSSRYFVCGPDPMMRAVREEARTRGVETWFSLETYMGCGVGVCNGCSVPVTSSAKGGWPYAKACLDGPVFPDGALLDAAFVR